MDDIHCHERPQQVLALVHSGFGEGYTATKPTLKQIIATVESEDTENLPTNVNKLLNSKGRCEELAKLVDGLKLRLGHEKLVESIKSTNREEVQGSQQQSQRRYIIVQANAHNTLTHPIYLDMLRSCDEKATTFTWMIGAVC